MNVEFTRMLKNKFPEIPWNKQKRIKPNYHWGQRKLLLSEIEYFCVLRNKTDINKCLVVYIGAAGGHHIPLIRQLFPKLNFLLYDPEKFLFKPDSNIIIKLEKMVFSIVQK